MSRHLPFPSSHGPFRADHVRDGDPYEISAGHAIRVMPTGSRGSDAAATAAIVLKSDPAVEQAGVETGYKLASDTLRAPDVAVGNVPLKPGWVTGAPPLAVEYADTGQDEADLKTKIREFFAGGTRFVWVVRLSGPRRVEVYEPGREKRLAHAGDQLEAPGILRNPVPVEALYDWQVGQEVALRNLLQRHGYESLEAVRAEGEATGEAKGKAEGKAEGQLEALRGAILDLFTVRGLAASEEVKATIAACSDVGLLKRWHLRAAIAADAADIYFDDSK
ncbi:MAG: Uma2 family endonuclease [Thermoanaerobaculia bacterium]|nr:Uma2 family endonuclease [Thermoanaerobaculia bacterium]